jgi:hypothetical protein
MGEQMGEQRGGESREQRREQRGEKTGEQRGQQRFFDGSASSSTEQCAGAPLGGGGLFLVSVLRPPFSDFPETRDML